MMAIVEMHKNAIRQVYDKEYYIPLFDGAFRSKGYNEETLDALTDPSDIVSLWNDFWFRLPDYSSIHRDPFNLICDICEYDYREDDV